MHFAYNLSSRKESAFIFFVHTWETREDTCAKQKIKLIIIKANICLKLFETVSNHESYTLA